MSKNQHNPETDERPINQNDQMSEDPGDGSRNSATLGRHGSAMAADQQQPGQDRQDETAIEAFGQEGAGIAAKE